MCTDMSFDVTSTFVIYGFLDKAPTESQINDVMAQWSSQSYIMYIIHVHLI